MDVNETTEMVITNVFGIKKGFTRNNGSSIHLRHRRSNFSLKEHFHHLVCFTSTPAVESVRQVDVFRRTKLTRSARPLLGSRDGGTDWETRLTFHQHARPALFMKVWKLKRGR